MKITKKDKSFVTEAQRHRGLLFKAIKHSLCLCASVSIMLLILVSPVQAKIETVQFDTEQKEKDYKVLIAELRCLVCQNQNLADSNAELAQDLRRQVVELLNKGQSRDEVVDYMVARYGDFVMYRPPLKSSTLLLWFGPVLFFIVAAYVVASFMRKQKQTSDVEISAEQKQKAHSFLDE